jgi:hypothetical protein
MNTTTLRAQALAALPEPRGNDLPADIQVFPPGDAVEFTLQDYPGEKFTMTVDASVAAKAQADLEKLQAAALAGRGSKPFADKNHEDAEATFHPVRFFWGGNDPKTGGVRVATNWTGFGASLVKARAMSYFSGNFLFNKLANKFLGLINENIGGLVNRPGFASQQAFAKASDTSIADLDIKATIRRINKAYGLKVSLDAENPLLEAADQLAQNNASGYMLELNRLALLEPELQRYHDYLAAGMDQHKNQELSQEIQLLQDEADKKAAAESLLAKAKANQQRYGVGLEHAQQLAVNEFQRESPPRDQKVTEHTIRRRNQLLHVFAAHAAAYAAAHGLSTYAGQAAFARTPAGRALYNEVL